MCCCHTSHFPFDGHYQCEKNNQLDQMHLLAYRYDLRKAGELLNHLDHCFSLIPLDGLISYEEGESRGLGQIPPHIQKRFLLEGEAALSAEDKHFMDILREKELDTEKMAADRRRGFIEFLEAYDLLTIGKCRP
jgi:hypothetical protein